MIKINFEGWFECRLATDPDPCDEKRGVSGWTFAYGTEPDLDGIICFQRRRGTPRPFSKASEVGVKVISVNNNTRHALVGGLVDLEPALRQVDGSLTTLPPKFNVFNNFIEEQRNEIIEPFHLTIKKDQFYIGRQHIADPSKPLTSIWETDRSLLKQRLPIGEGRIDWEEKRWLKVLKVKSPNDYRSMRAGQLEEEKDKPENFSLKDTFELRIKELQRTDRRFYGNLIGYRKFKLNLNENITQNIDNTGILNEISYSEPWEISFWMGVWDADSLCGFTEGELILPTS